MRDLTPALIEELSGVVNARYAAAPGVADLVNTVIDDETDFEHIITFLDDSPSALHQELASDLREAFVRVLRRRLSDIERDLGAPPAKLYQALLDMYNVEHFWEDLRGILTLNYDEYIEFAVESVDREVDFGVEIGGEVPSLETCRLLKLHGSFGWSNEWPIARLRGEDEPPLWIPPGIQKTKDRYPFNVLWGLARELLNCDVLRIVGCNLGPNDWDLVSLLFATQHTHAERVRPYRVEVIDSPRTAARLREQFPYLDVRSIFEAEPAGSRLLGEVAPDVPHPYGSLTPEEQFAVDERATETNWFLVWLQHMAEGAFERLGSINTPKGFFQGLLEAG